MSRTFSTNWGSVESLKVSVRCGANEKALQMRCTVEMDIRSIGASAARAAIEDLERRMHAVTPIAPLGDDRPGRRGNPVGTAA